MSSFEVHINTRRVALAAGLLLFASLAMTEPFRGPFTLNDGLTFYMINPDGAAFDHTIVQVTDGTWLGSSGFCHRTPGHWTGPQYGAGLGPMGRDRPKRRRRARGEAVALCN